MCKINHISHDDESEDFLIEEFNSNDDKYWRDDGLAPVDILSIFILIPLLIVYPKTASSNEVLWL